MRQKAPRGLKSAFHRRLHLVRCCDAQLEFVIIDFEGERDTAGTRTPASRAAGTLRGCGSFSYVQHSAVRNVAQTKN